jgi:hypothetical protein
VLQLRVSFREWNKGNEDEPVEEGKKGKRNRKITARLMLLLRHLVCFFIAVGAETMDCGMCVGVCSRGRGVRV